jgi:phosphoglycolate phosphatase-like HAD superfamily hydrolase
MFKEMRDALGIHRSVDIIDHIRSLSNEPDSSANPADGEQAQVTPPHSTTNPDDPPSEEMLAHRIEKPDPHPSSEQARAVDKIKAIERRAMTSQRPQPGLRELMHYLTRRGVRKAICTRNFPAPVHHLLSNYVPDEVFDPIITRETEGIQPKPSPEGLWSIAQAWGLDREIDGDLDSLTSTAEHADPLELAKRYLGSGLIMVGDSRDDVAAGYRAGAATVLLRNEENEDVAKHHYTGLSINRLDELIDLLEKGFAEEK